MRQLGTAITFLLACILPVGAQGETKERYNVLLILADDLNSRIAPLGDTDAITPNLTRLAARSITYSNCLAQYALCAPSRASLLTGLYPWSLGVHQGGGAHAGADDVVPRWQWLSEYFRSQGFWAGSYGKVEHDPQPEKWDELVPLRVSVSGSLISSRDFAGYKGITGVTTHLVYDGDPDLFTDGLAASRAIEAMDRALEADENFFVAAGLYQPHTPWIVQSGVSDQYDAASLRLPGDPAGSYEIWPSYAYPRGKATDERPLMPEAEARELLKAYYGSVSMMDHAVGQLLDFVEARGLWDNTVIVFASDNGFSLLEHRHLFSKRNYSRESLHVPMMVHNPGMNNEGEVCERQVGLIDIFPTLVDLAGVAPYPQPLDGQSLAPLQENPSSAWDKPALSVLTYPTCSRPRFRIAQLGNWKLVEGPWDRNPAWFRRAMDHENDPFEYFPVRPDSEGLEVDFSPMERALTAIPFQQGVFHVGKPDNPADRDGDGITDEVELGLQALGFSPFVANPGMVSRFREQGLSISRDPELGIRLSLEGFPVNEERFKPYHQVPLALERSQDLLNWQAVEGGPVLLDRNNLVWVENPGVTSKRFYRLRIRP